MRVHKPTAEIIPSSRAPVDMHPSRYRPDVFLQLKQSALNLARKTALYAAPPSTQPSTPKPDGPILPLPKPLAPQLISLGVDETSAHRISSSLTRASSSLKELCEKEFQRRFKTSPSCCDDPQSVSRIPSALSAIYTRATREWTSYLLDNVTPRVLHLQSQTRTIRSLSGPSPKVPFNHNATPALETFFEDNAFPSRLEKHELASKWGMRYRQVDVWFQNRRRRFKKEGKELKQRPFGNALLRDLEQTVVDYLLPLLPEDEEVGPGQRDGENDVPSFNLEPPAHAFPGPWPPLCPYDPFPIALGERVFETPWLRSPSTMSHPPRPTVLDVEELIHTFRDLTFSEDSDAEACSSPSRRCGAQPCPALSYIGFTTHCLRAPLPALLNNPRRTSRSRRNCSSVPQAHASAAKGQHKKIPGSSYPSSRNGSIQRASSPPSTPEGQSPQIPPVIAPSRRAKRNLPKRYPKNPPMRSGTEGATTRPVVAVSASTSSTRSLSSKTSSASDIDSPLSTPQLLSMSLPDPIVFDASQSWISYPHAQSPVDALGSGLSFPKEYQKTCAPILTELYKLPDDSSPISLYISPPAPRP